MAEASAQPASHGLVLGRYRPLRPLGSGGMGSVWHAFDERKGREVALKIVPRAGTAGPRAEREATAATQLRHPACLRAYALARDDGHVYIAYEYVPGRTFRHALERGELDDEAAIEATAQILDGLAHAHSRGIVHRDVKPANVLLTDEDGSVRILDFGLALVREEEETLTAQGDVPGTLAYISPERLAGKPAGPETDIWSTGVLLWEALAGRHPFGSGPFLEITKRIGRGAPALASARPELPKPLTQLVDAMLSTDPAKRPPAAKLASGLRRAAVARPGAADAPPVGAAHPAGRPPPRARDPRRTARGLGDHDLLVLAGALASPPGRARGAPLRDRPPSRARVRARDADPAAREHLARARRALQRRRARLARRLLATAARGAALPGGATARRRRGDRASTARRHPGRRAGAARSPDRCGSARRRGRRGSRRSRAAGRRRRGAQPRARGSIKPDRCALRPLGRPVGVVCACPRDDRARRPPRPRSARAAGAAPGAAPRSERSCSAPRSSPTRTPQHCRSSPPPGSPRSSCRAEPATARPMSALVRRFVPVRPRLRAVPGS